MSLSIKFLQADSGDAILIAFQDEKNLLRHILIDGGQNQSFRKVLSSEVKAIYDKKRFIDLLIVTHYDDDHIGGILPLVQIYKDTPLIEKYWFNSCRLLAKKFNSKYDESLESPLGEKSNSVNISFKQSQTLEGYLSSAPNKTNQDFIEALNVYNFYNTKITILSPTRETLKKLSKFMPKSYNGNISAEIDFQASINELISRPYIPDTSEHNGSSIAFLFEYKNTKGLFLGDAHAEIVTNSLKKLGFSRSNPLILDIFKISHHGSSRNTSEELLEIINCTNFVLTSNKGFRKTALSRIISFNNLQKRAINLHFNYENDSIKGLFTRQEIIKHNINLNFANTKNALQLNF